MATEPTSMKANLGQLETVLDAYLGKKAPALPANIKESLVKFAPYIAILGIILSVPAVLTLFGLSAFLSAVPFGAAATARIGFSYYLGIAFLLITVVLDGMAIPGLLAKTKKGWNLLYYSTLVNAVYSLLSVNIAGLLLGTVLGLYLLFQVKSYYH